MKANVLIVDDDEAMRDSLVFSLQRENKWWTITVASGANEAREIINAPGAEPIDVVLTDLVMGQEGSGIDVLECAKAKDPFMMVIVFTAQEKELDRFEAYRHGAFDCVEKNMIGKRAWKEISVKANAAIDFRRLLLAELESQKRLAMLQSFFDPRVFDAVQENPKLLGVRMRPATVVFWDIRGFSHICNTLGANPESLREMMFEYYSLATDIIFRHHGILDKFIGDGIMALFFPLRPENDDGAYGAGHATAAALDLAVRFRSIVKRWEVQWNVPGTAPLQVGLGCGMHTGKSLVGNLGTARREQFTAIGPTVNFAARLETLAKPDQILASQATARFLERLAGTPLESLLQRIAVEPVGAVSNIKNMPGRHGVFSIRER